MRNYNPFSHRDFGQNEKNYHISVLLVNMVDTCVVLGIAFALDSCLNHRSRLPRCMTLVKCPEIMTVIKLCFYRPANSTPCDGTVPYFDPCTVCTIKDRKCTVFVGNGTIPRVLAELV